MPATVIPASLPQSPILAPFSPWKSPNPFPRTVIPIPRLKTPKPFSIQSLFLQNPNPIQNHPHRHSVRSFAGRGKKRPSMSSKSKESLLETRERLNRQAREEDLKLVDSFFRRVRDPHNPSNYPDNFSESELKNIGLGYDRLVRFMKKDDPNLKHPYDWYKYGEYGPYSWRGVVLGDPVRGTITDECATLITEVEDQEEFERIDQHEMSVDFAQELKKMDPKLGFKHFWVFIRHPRWRLSDLPWQQWTLVCEVVVESRNQRLDKWSLMGRFDNRIRALITQCAAWMRPDILYVRRPIYQCRFEPQADFFKAMVPFLDPETEKDFMFELEVDGKVEPCTYFGGLCRLAKVNPKSFVDDVVNAFDKLGDEKKNKCLEFLLTNHPIPLLHPYTREWKVKLEEMELGCDAPDEDDDDQISGIQQNPNQIEEEDDDNVVVDDNLHDDELGFEEDGEEEDEVEEIDLKQWEENMKKAVRTSQGMENLLKRSVEMADKIMTKKKDKIRKDGDETEMRGRGAKIPREEYARAGIGRGGRRIRKTKMPPGLALKAAVRPFTYKNLVKEIVLVRHAIVEGEIGLPNSTNNKQR